MGSPYHMSIIRNGNVALSNLRKLHVTLSILRKLHVDFKKTSCRHVDFTKVPCHMSLRPKKGSVAVSILGVYTSRKAFFSGLNLSLGLRHKLLDLKRNAWQNRAAAGGFNIDTRAARQIWRIDLSVSDHRPFLKVWPQLMRLFP